MLHVETGGDRKGHAVDVPVIADPGQGGLVPTQPIPPLPDGKLTAVVRGKWGFDDWEGPRYQLVSSQAGKWSLAADDQSALVVGREDSLHLEGRDSGCVEKVAAETVGNPAIPVAWKPLKPGTLKVTMPLKDTAPGPVSVEVYQFGIPEAGSSGDGGL